MKTHNIFSLSNSKKFKNQKQDYGKKNLDKKGRLIDQLQCSLAKIEMVATPAPSVVKTMN
jgi:hypothetical protein